MPPKYVVHHPADDVLRRPEQHDGDRADRADGDQKTVTELPQVLRERHLLLIPRRLDRFPARVAAPAITRYELWVPRPGVGGGTASPGIDAGLDVVHDVGVLPCARWRASSRAFAAASSASACPTMNSFLAWPALRASFGKFVRAEEQRADDQRCR